MGRREELAMREWQEIISREHIREHIRVASRELPLRLARKIGRDKPNSIL
jgi:hypothetical protein